MHRSEERILTTHIGSLPRTEELLDLLSKRDRGEEIDEEAYWDAVDEAVRQVVERQDEAGLDIINDGEQGRVGFNTYLKNRMTGFEGTSTAEPWKDLTEYPDYARKILATTEELEIREVAAATGPVEYRGEEYAEREADHLFDAMDDVGVDPAGTFITSATPGVVATTLHNEYYDSHEEYVYALADAMQEEYEIFADSDLDVIQLDSPDLLMDHHKMFADRSVEEFKDVVRTHIDAMNQATQNIDDERLRLHVCWGNYEGPHHHDIDLAEILPILYEANIGGLCVELSNPRHQHEFEVFEEHPLPDDWVLYPGVIDVKTNFIEHPEVVADRIEHAADVIGDPTRVVAAPDCGFGTLAGWERVDTEIGWDKLAAMSEGAEIASERLF